MKCTNAYLSVNEWHFFSYCSAGPCHAVLSPSLNATTITGQTALHDAVILGHREVVGLLIKHGADVNIASNAEQPKDHSYIASACSPLETSCLQGDLEMIKLLLSNGAQDVDYKCLNSAIMAERTEVITVLLQQGRFK